ncbi:MAG TPA: phosphotransferase, partial [Mycobacteriales bacterium]|nr:phosphotransferase [Mycobacteriales bacterium]
SDNHHAQPLTGGVSADVTRVGDKVRRSPSSAALTIHRFLEYLRAKGFDRVPRPRGFDKTGGELFDFIEGRAGHPPITPEIASDEALIAAAQAIREFHDLSVGFTGTGWLTDGADPSGVAEVICHNDLAPFNLIYRSRSVAAIIDWDGAAPGRRAWDLAYAAWRLVPLHRPGYAGLVGWPDLDRARRLALFVDSYGLDEPGRAGFVELIRERQIRTIEGMRRLADAGRITPLPPEDPRAEAGDLPYLSANAAEWDRAVRHA